MHDFIQILKRFIPPYKWKLGRNILFNFLHAAFGGASFAMMAPVLGILFGTQEDVTTKVPWEITIDAVKHNFYFFITSIKDHYGAPTALILIGGVMVLAVLLKTAFSYLAAYEMVYIRNGVVRDIRNLIYKKILQLPLPFFSEEKKGDILARMTGDVQEVENSIMNSLEMFFKNPIIIIVYLAMMIIMSWQLTLFVFILLPIAGTIIGRVGKSLKRSSMEGQNKMGQILSFIEESLSGLRIIKAFTAEKHMNEAFSKDNDDYRRIMNHLMRRRYLAHPMSEFLGTIVVVIVLWFGGQLILSGDSTLKPQDFMAYMVIFYSIINPAKAFSNALYSIQKGLALWTG